LGVKRILATEDFGHLKIWGVVSMIMAKGLPLQIFKDAHCYGQEITDV
jgi:hypothetical protein